MIEIVTTLKGGQGYEQPWTVIHTDSIAEMNQQLDEAEATDLGGRVARAAEVFRAQVVAAGSLGAVPVAPNVTPSQALAAPPVAAPVAPAGPPVPACKHGAMTFRQNKPGGKPWKAYFCNTPKGTPDQCEPEWIRD